MSCKVCPAFSETDGCMDWHCELTEELMHKAVNEAMTVDCAGERTP